MHGKGRRDVEVNDDVDNFLTALVLDILEIPKGYRGVSALQDNAQPIMARRRDSRTHNDTWREH
jgi:hypothetical protein